MQEWGREIAGGVEGVVEVLRRKGVLGRPIRVFENGRDLAEK